MNVYTTHDIEELIEMAKKFNGAAKGGAGSGLNADEVAPYDALAHNEESVRELATRCCAKLRTN